MTISARLHNQGLLGNTFTSAQQLLSWMGSIQAQDYASAKWAIGARMPNETDASVTQAINDGKIVRTWLMRGTIHMVATEDVRWMNTLTAPGNVVASTPRRQQLGFDERTILRSHAILSVALKGGKLRTREELYTLLEDKGISTTDQRGYHLLWRAAQDGVLCFAGQRFVALDDWVPAQAPMERDQALGELAKRYFQSRGPATLKDFQWWSGMTASDAERGLDVIKAELEMHTYDGHELWAMPGEPPAFQYHGAALPAFDEYLLGYKERGMVLDPLYNNRVCPPANGLFQPLMLIQGKVVGTWKRDSGKDIITIKTEPFVALNPKETRLFALALEEFSKFHGKKIAVK
ncbi:MAG: winged helix DNA-binding domain-containing protein [Pseudomonadota bacterium]